MCVCVCVRAASCTRWYAQKPCLRRRSLPASQEAPQTSLLPPLGVHAGERPNPRNNAPRSAIGPFKQEGTQAISHKASTRQARHRKAGISARQCEKTLPQKVPLQGTRPSKHHHLCIGQCAATCQRSRHASPQIPLRILSTLRDPCAPGTHSFTTIFL